MLRIILLYFTLTSFLFADNVSDPLKDLLSTSDHQPGEKVYRLRYNLDNNTGEAIFLTNAHYVDNKTGMCFWVLYLKRGNNYISATYIDSKGIVNKGAVLAFNIHEYQVGYIKQINKFGLLTRETMMGRHGGNQLRAVVVTGDHFELIKVGDFVPDDSTTPDPFPDPPTPPIEVLNP